MALVVACLVNPRLSRYRRIADDFASGIARSGDKPIVRDIRLGPIKADVAVRWGWKRPEELRAYPRFVWADHGYWKRGEYVRLTVGGWSPDKYVQAGLPSDRFDSLGLKISPWRTTGNEIVVAGSTSKAAADNGMAYMEWEQRAVQALKDCGRPVVYRPKPKDAMATAIAGVGYDQRPIEEALGRAWGWVTHHSNSAVDALLAGIPVHCEIGAAAVMSVPISEIANPVLPEGREQFLKDVAWLQWTMNEIKSGDAWMHLKARGLIC